jgi:hypothetical protein
MRNLFQKIRSFDFSALFNRPDLPISYRLVNYALLFATLAWPLLLLASIFLFDAPGNDHKLQLNFLFFLILFYPFITLAMIEAGFTHYAKKRLLAMCCTGIALVVQLLIVFLLTTL